MERSENLCVEKYNSCFLVDEYCHESSSVVYTPINIPGSGADLEEFETQLVAGCSCVSCDTDMCPCVAKFGRNYDDGKLLLHKFNGPVMECNTTCSCCSNQPCGNCVIQLGPFAGLEVYDSGTSKGLALKTKLSITCGTFICEYAGEVIGKEEARKRFQKQSVTEKNYIFALREHVTDGSVITTFVDPTCIGNIGRYINHSCDPNCVVVPVRVDSFVPRLSIFAARNIEKGEEITFDYGQSSGRAQCVDVVARMTPCLCGAGNCRKFLPFDDTV